MHKTVFIGHDRREQRAFDVCMRSLVGHAATLDFSIHPISRRTLGDWYTRPVKTVHGREWDVISDAAMATDFSLARFWAQWAATGGWALYVDGDFLFRADVSQLFACADSRYAVQVVKHNHQPREATKMPGMAAPDEDGRPRAQLQTRYPRKNWSSCMLINTAHAGWNRLTKHELNSKPGLYLHQFGWLRDDEIGELPGEWNVLDGEGDGTGNAWAYHYTRGTPDMLGDKLLGHEDEWWSWLTQDEIDATDFFPFNSERPPCKPANSATA